MLLAELEVRHSRAIAPTRRVALGRLFLPVEGTPSAAALLLGGIVGAFVGSLSDDDAAGVDRLLDDVERGWRIPQPRLWHRFQTDTVGLDRSTHRLHGRAVGGDGDEAGEPHRLDRLDLEVDDHGAPLPNVLAAIYAAGRLSYTVRGSVLRTLRKASRWDGPADATLLDFLAGDEASRLRRRWVPGDPGWALAILRFPSGSAPSADEVNRRFRELIRKAHPDHGATIDGAGARILELTEAKRILLSRT